MCTNIQAHRFHTCQQCYLRVVAFEVPELTIAVSWNFLNSDLYFLSNFFPLYPFPSALLIWIFFNRDLLAEREFRCLCVSCLNLLYLLSPRVWFFSKYWGVTNNLGVEGTFSTPKQFYPSSRFYPTILFVKFVEKDICSDEFVVRNFWRFLFTEHEGRNMRVRCHFVFLSVFKLLYSIFRVHILGPSIEANWLNSFLKRYLSFQHICSCTGFPFMYVILC